MCLLLLVGLGFTIYSLVSMRSCGKKGILGYGIASLSLYLLFILGAVVTVPLVQRMAKRQAEVAKIVDDLQAKTPVMVDDYTRLDRVLMLAPNHVGFEFSNNEIPSYRVNRRHWDTVVVPRLRKGMPDSEHFPLLELGLGITYFYSGTDGVRFASVTFRPQEYLSQEN